MNPCPTTAKSPSSRILFFVATLATVISTASTACSEIVPLSGYKQLEGGALSTPPCLVLEEALLTARGLLNRPHLPSEKERVSSTLDDHIRQMHFVAGSFLKLPPSELDEVTLGLETLKNTGLGPSGRKMATELSVPALQRWISSCPDSHWHLARAVLFFLALPATLICVSSLLFTQTLPTSVRFFVLIPFFVLGVLSSLLPAPPLRLSASAMAIACILAMIALRLPVLNLPAAALMLFSIPALILGGVGLSAESFMVLVVLIAAATAIEAVLSVETSTGKRWACPRWWSQIAASSLVLGFLVYIPTMTLSPLVAPYPLLETILKTVSSPAFLSLVLLSSLWIISTRLPAPRGWTFAPPPPLPWVKTGKLGVFVLTLSVLISILSMFMRPAGQVAMAPVSSGSMTAQSEGLSPAKEATWAEAQDATAEKSALILDARPPGSTPAIPSHAVVNPELSEADLADLCAFIGAQPVYVFCANTACNSSKILAAKISASCHEEVYVIKGGAETWLRR